MDHQIVTKIAKRLLLVFLFLSVSMYSQKNSNNFFSLYKGSETHLKPIKYILYDLGKDKCKKTEKGIIFYVEGEVFSFEKERHSRDNLDIESLKSIEFSKANKLNKEERLFYKKKISEDKLLSTNKTNIPFPIVKTHRFFKVFILLKKNSSVIKYEVDWTYEGTRGFNVLKN